MILTAIYLYCYDYKQTGNLIHLRGLFSLFWLGGQGLSCFKLSYLQKEWSQVTWLCFFCAIAGFWLTFEMGNRRNNQKTETAVKAPVNTDYLLNIIIGLTLVSFLAFILEAVILGYIPFFLRGVPHAYSEFHISGVHYFTVSCVLVPGLVILYLLFDDQKNKYKRVLVIVAMISSILIPILCVSRFQLIFAVVLAIFTYVSVKHQLKIKYVIILMAMLIPLYLILTVARSHDVSYLNGIFEMKYDAMPIFITQPYMYITNNYDNFNCLVEQLPKHTWGIRMLFPVWALSGLKFIIPELVNYPLYINKEELTTLTLFYDSYYDFGIFGVICLSSLLGLISVRMTKALEKFKNPVSYLFYAQFAGYMMLCFFTTWFSNPTTWFYFVMTGIMWGYCYLKKGEHIL